MNSKKKPLLYDSLIIGRVQKCLEEDSQKALADINTVTRWLQAKYPEYRRRRQGPFRQLVKQAYKIVCDSLLKDYEQMSGEEKPEAGAVTDSENEEDITPPTRNIMSNLMNNLYNKPTQKKMNPKRKSTSADDAISISSEESATIEPSQNVRQLEVFHSNDSTMQSGEDLYGQTSVYTENAQQPLDVNKKITEKNIALVNSAIANYEQESVGFQEVSEDKSQERNEKRKRSQNDVQQKQRKRAFKKQVTAEESKLTFEDLGGMDKLFKKLCEMLINVIAPETYQKLGLQPPNGILIHGASGCGKTSLAKAIAGQMEFLIIKVTATELIAGISGESEERIRDVFEQAVAFAPCVLFIDEIDAVATNRSLAQKDMQHRITSQLISCLDNLKKMSFGARILVIGATTRPDSLDPALRRAGRFDYEIAIPIPDRNERKEILRILCKDLMVESGLDFDKIAALIPGYVGADMTALVSRAAAHAVKRIWSKELQLKELQGVQEFNLIENQDSVDFKNTVEVNTESVIELEPPNDSEPSLTIIAANDEQSITEIAEITISDCNNDEISNDIEKNSLRNVENQLNDQWEPTLAQMLNWLSNPPQNIDLSGFSITMDDFCHAIKKVLPTARREGFITVPDVTWDDIGSLRDIREQLRLAILAPVKFPDKMKRLGLSTPTGVLLCGPPGCGKTLIAKAIANEAGINFISVKGPELMNMYVGESERSVRECFQRARNSAPCVIFFDEFDSLCPKRSDSAESGSGVRVVNQLLTEMDGIEDRKGVYIMAATNRPDIIDPAILRPGRLDTILYIGMPQVNDRFEILRAATKNGKSPVLAEDVDFMEVAKMTEGFTGADLSGLIRQAAQLALKDAIALNYDLNDICVKAKNINDALLMTRPSVNGNDQKLYEKLQEKYASNRKA